MRRSILLVALAACGPEEDFAEDQDTLTSAEISLLSLDAKLWRQTASLGRCGAWSLDEDFSSGRYNVHRFALDLSPGGPTTVRFARTAAAWQPAILVGTRAGELVYGGEESSSAAGVTAELIASGRADSFAEVRLFADAATSVDIYVTGFNPLDTGFRSFLPRSSRYTLSADQECAVPSGDWQALAGGLTQGGAEIPRRGITNLTLERTLGVRVEPYGTVVALEGLELVEGRTSHFGGPNDTGVSSTETGAITGERLRSLNNPLHPSQATLQSRPEDYYYAAMRFDYTNAGRTFWSSARLLLVNPRTNAAAVVRPVDWGPNTSTARLIDLSPQVMDDLGIETDDTIAVSFALPGAALGVVSSD